jgi:hypothetical protein
VRYYQAQDTFVAGLEDGTEKLVAKGEAHPENHELVKRDLAASKKDESRIPLFRAMDDGEPPAAPKSRAPSRSKDDK